MDYSIQGLIEAALKNIKEMVNVNTIVGDPVETPDGTVIIPISKVSFGFGAGGSEFGGNQASGKSLSDSDPKALFGGGSGGGVAITPVAFMVVGNGQIRLLPVEPNRGIVEQLVDQVPFMIDKVNEMIKSKPKSKSGTKSKSKFEKDDFDEDEDE